MSSTETVVDTEIVEHAIHQLGLLDSEFCLGGVRVIDYISMLEELLRHRDNEDDAYWGEDDE